MAEKGLPQSRLITIGSIGKPVGLTGSCLVRPHGATLERMRIPVGVFAGVSESNCSPMIIEKRTSHPKGFLCTFGGVNDPENAGRLHGMQLFIETRELPRLSENAFYHFELVGMKVATDTGRQLGQIAEVHNFPTVDSVEVGISPGTTVMIPLTGEAIAGIDREAGIITVRQTFIDELL